MYKIICSNLNKCKIIQIEIIEVINSDEARPSIPSE